MITYLLAAAAAAEAPVQNSVAYDIAGLISLLWNLLVVVAVVGVVYALITDDRDPSTVIAWLFVIILVPLLGIIVYFFIGRNYRRDTRARVRFRQMLAELEGRNLKPTVEANAAFTDAARAKLAGTPAARIERAGEGEDSFVPLPADSVEVYTSGFQKFPALLEDLPKAQRYIHIMYLIWKKDELTAKVTEVLLERLRAGVEVNIIYDWLSCITYSKEELKKLKAAGATVVPCYRKASHVNYRNHMKMVVIDGEILYTGGMNMAQEYADGGARFDVWRDTHLRMTGPIVAPYIALYAETWLTNGRKEDMVTGYIAEPVHHEPGEGIPVQMVHSSVRTPHKAIRDVFIIALTNARQRVWVQSPYFVPDEPLITAMCVAAKSGVDVRFMMTGWPPDKKIPYYAAQAYFWQLVDAGVKVYQYRAGSFLHAKTVTVDDQLVIIGTCNWDIRSIILHDEVVSVIYDEGIAADYAAHYEDDITQCTLVTQADLDGRGNWQRFRNHVCRLFSRLL